MAQTHEIFATLERDHKRHRELLDKLLKTSGDSDERETLFTELTRELKSHAAAEEQALPHSCRDDPLVQGAAAEFCRIQDECAVQRHTESAGPTG